ncbi:hypothetical protein HRbin40_01006 [bacterium HR40]|nr:hypothetical protein HRbin40_01006 [bacterium HR40]
MAVGMRAAACGVGACTRPQGRLPLFTADTGRPPTAIAAMAAALRATADAVTPAESVAIGQHRDGDARDPATGTLPAICRPFLRSIVSRAALSRVVRGRFAGVAAFGSFLVLSVAESPAIDRRRAGGGRAGCGVFLQDTSTLPFWAILQDRERPGPSDNAWRRRVAALSLWGARLSAHGPLPGRSHS